MAKRYYSSTMISEDKSAPSLLPREVVSKEWPSMGYYEGRPMADLFTGVQMTTDSDTRKLKEISKKGGR